MIIKCAICAEYCPNHMSYVIHKELMHTAGVIALKKGQYLTKKQKSAIVERGEVRLGKQNFIGG